MLAVALSFFVVAVFANFPPGFDAVGIVDPGLYHQRYRGAELGSHGKPFFQWWFFWIALGDGKHVTMMYSTSRVTHPLQNAGAFVGMSLVDGARKGFRCDRFPSMNTSAAKAPLWMQVNTGLHGSIEPLSNSSWRIRGSLDASGNSTFHSDPILANQTISWDVTISRISGWYGEEGIIDELADSFGRGMISWNPYAHQSTAEGTATIGDRVYKMHGQRAYCDMNWGNKFPTAPAHGDWPSNLYGWGWYSMRGVSATGGNVSVIVGLGLAESGFPLYSIFAGFADFSIDDGQQHITARHVAGLYDTPERVDLISLGSDGEMKRFNVTRSQWVNYTDSLGTVSIPLAQQLVIETKYSVFSAECVSTFDKINRLLMPYQNMVFSDFETLGASCTFKIVTNGTVVVSAVDDDAGVEYGRA